MPMDRSVVLSGTVTILRGVKAVPVLPIWTPKDPADVANYAADFAALANGQAITAAAASVSTTGTLALAGPATWAGTVVSVPTRGGADGEMATIVITAAFGDGEVLRRGVLLPVVQQSGPAGGDPLLLEDGGAIVLEDSTTPLALE